MKRMLLFLAVIVALSTLSSFALVNMQEQKNLEDEPVYHTKITGWFSETESFTCFVYYKNGVEGRYYMIQPHEGSKDYWSIYDNEYYNSPVCSDFRTKFRYVANGFYFNCDLPHRAKEYNNGLVFYTQIKGWSSDILSGIYSIYYSSVDRVHYVKSSDIEYWSIYKNEYYNSPKCHDYRKNFRYVANEVYFNCDKLLLR